MTTSLRRATLADISAAAATLSSAFTNYPWTRWSIPEDEYESRLERLQAAYLTHALEHGIVIVSDNCAGVAALLPPDSPEPAAHVQQEIGALLGSRLAALFELELPPRLPDSWDFATLGVHPSHAGRGLGSALIGAALATVASSAHPCVSLETSAASNVALYERHGFLVTHRTEIEHGPVVFTMGREL
ncbi:GNAT family N-acetyltransferase [Leucobacter luti]|uniref:Ribosomal protein S18 acetylase RimI-like enzyme n=1 Tax=Leucobacter luti TaxID=340320 RepID=A0A4R6S1P8_9MICO|nr:GNAT family N-acetyltransferase [Leucobacter luti]MCW2287688.1 ribosomal protein S18 acetylase RimI-like enzyme [Leucobacter luti]QYM76288.1 GNAT family N-acetyltransferase [Leucobacter luti]TCK46147.1 ribosomal protein S18 acetylase RimI-like enzyme [Leucobacter luti]TDP92566.1 ribosomal protein S18 acetylase RimI-like enzyme [Leucobacter luti]